MEAGQQVSPLGTCPSRSLGGGRGSCQQSIPVAEQRVDTSGGYMEAETSPSSQSCWAGHPWLQAATSVDPSEQTSSFIFPKSTRCKRPMSLTAGAILVVALIYSSNFRHLPASDCWRPSGIRFGGLCTGARLGAGSALLVSCGPLNGRRPAPKASFRGATARCVLLIALTGGF